MTQIKIEQQETSSKNTISKSFNQQQQKCKKNIHIKVHKLFILIIISKAIHKLIKDKNMNFIKKIMEKRQILVKFIENNHNMYRCIKELKYQKITKILIMERFIIIIRTIIPKIIMIIIKDFKKIQ